MAKKQSRIKIGWASLDITPKGTSDLRGQFHVRISEKVNDPLLTTALALESEDTKEQAVMISIDSAGVSDGVRQSVRMQLEKMIPDLDPDQLFISATHTHTAPSQTSGNYPPQKPEVIKPEEYAEFLAAKIAEAVSCAWQNRSAGALGFGCAPAVVGCNRRMTRFSGESIMYGDTNSDDFSHIEGDEDHTVNMLTTYDGNENLTGMVVNIACPSQVTEGDSFVSADLWHEARSEIKSRFGQELHVLPQCSAAGDQSPHLMIGKRAEARMLTLKGLGDGAETERATLAMRMGHRQEIGCRIADAVEHVIPIAAKDIRKELTFEHRASVVDLPKRMVTEEERDIALEQVHLHEKQLSECTQDPADPEYSRNYCRIRYFQKVVDRYENQNGQPVLPMEMHVIRLGDVVFATNRFELFLDYGQRIKACSKALQTFVVQLAGEGTYLPTQRAVDSRSYGAGIESNLVGPEGGQVLVEQTLRLIDEMFEDCRQ